MKKFILFTIILTLQSGFALSSELFTKDEIEEIKEMMKKECLFYNFNPALITEFHFTEKNEDDVDLKHSYFVYKGKKVGATDISQECYNIRLTGHNIYKNLPDGCEFLLNQYYCNDNIKKKVFDMKMLNKDNYNDIPKPIQYLCNNKGCEFLDDGLYFYLDFKD